MTESMTLETFQPLHEESFTLSVGDDTTVSLRLDRVAALDAKYQPKHAVRISFSLEFVGPPAPTIPQGMYSLAHGDDEPFEIFIVPLSSDGSGTRYEAVFN
jgi:hypothetical protein